jgi:hypothetical protein
MINESVLATVPEAAVGIFAGGGAGTCLPGSRPGSPLMIGKSGAATVLDAGAWSQTMIIAGAGGSAPALCGRPGARP